MAKKPTGAIETALSGSLSLIVDTNLFLECRALDHIP
jgi:hypothetical protein